MRSLAAPAQVARSRAAQRIRPHPDSTRFRGRQSERASGRVNFALLAVPCLLWALGPFVLVWLGAERRGRVFLGAAGYVPGDQLQYLAWVRDATHGLIRNLYGSAGSAVFVHPLWTISGLVQALTGCPDVVLMAFWTAAGALAVAAGTARLVTRFIPAERRGRRFSALMLGVFGGLTPLLGLIMPVLGGDERVVLRAGHELMPAMSMWGYMPLAIALGLMPFAIEGFERLLAGRGGGHSTARVAALGLLVSWLHPWQGQVLLASYAGLVGWQLARPEGSGDPSLRGRLRALHVRKLLPVSAATAVPLIYYLVLSRVDRSWALSARLSVNAALIPWPVVLCGVLPLVLIALAACRRAAPRPELRPLVVFVGASFLGLAVSRSGQYRALDGLALPVCVLAVATWRARARAGGVLGGVLVLAMLVPAVVFGRWALDDLGGRQLTVYSHLRPADIAAARLAERLAGGGILLSDPELGTALPALTGDPSWVGHPIWTPDDAERETAVALLFNDDLGDTQARALLKASRAAAVVQPCGVGRDIGSRMARIGFDARPVGCARVYVPRRARPRAAVRVQAIGRALNFAHPPADHSA